MINAFPPKSGIHATLSPRNIVTGQTLNYNIHFKLPFGDYAQVHENEEPRNSMKKHTLGAICLGLRKLNFFSNELDPPYQSQ